MKIIALTGGIGSGKSTAGKYFKNLGCRVYEADRLAQALLRRTPVKAQIVRVLGSGVQDKKGRLSRRKIGEIVFKDKAKLAALEKILHPPVIHRIKTEIKKARAIKKSKQKTLIFIIPLLFEKKLESLFDGVISVSCPQNIRIERASRRLRLSKQEITRRMQFQVSSRTSENKSDWVIRNQGTLSEMEKKVKRIFTEISKKEA